MPGPRRARTADAPAPLTAGALREQLWGALLRARACGYPLPPHGHHPNFRGSAEAARHLLKHPRVTGVGALVVGPERALYGVRRLALADGREVIVPDQHRPGWYWCLRDPKGARLKAMPEVGEATQELTGAGAAVLACVGVSARGERLSKGFGWGASGIAGLTAFTLAHPLMLLEALPCPADSRVDLIALPDRVLEVAHAPTS